MRKYLKDRIRFVLYWTQDSYTEWWDDMLYHAWFRKLLVGFEITCVLSPIVVYVLCC
jgi:hypothetical protein